MKGEWLNVEKRIRNFNEIKIPCAKCGYCPYGQLIEEFRLRPRRNEYSCKVFGHDCPVYYLGEK